MSSLVGKVWAEAAKTFGKNNGHTESLTPFGRTWETILERSEHALLIWGQKYGPLNRAQWDYAAELLVHALVAARKADSPGEMYAYFHTRLTHLLNHERTQEGFEKRAEVDRESNAILDLLEEDAA